MNAFSWINVLCHNDIRLVRRDSLLRWMFAAPLVYAFALRWAVPPITQRLADSIDLVLYYPLIVGFLLITCPPIMFGMVIAFLFLDERDDHTFDALRVTPLPIHWYFFL